MKILVTGGAGFIGSHVCEALIARGDAVICVDNFNDYYNPKIKEKNIEGIKKDRNFTVYKKDITEKDALKGIFEKEAPEKVIHLAAMAGVRYSSQEPQVYAKVNGIGTINVLELCKDFKVKSVVFSSSSSVYGNSSLPFKEDQSTENQESIYAAAKKSAELICSYYHKQYGLTIAILRLFTVYGPRGRPDMAIYGFTEKINKGVPIEIYGEGTKRDYTNVKDTVRAILLALDKELKFEIINVASGNPVELPAIIELLEKNIGKKAKIIRKPVQRGDVDNTWADITKAKLLLGYKPNVPIAEGIKEFVGWYKRSQGAMQ